MRRAFLALLLAALLCAHCAFALAQDAPDPTAVAQKGPAATRAMTQLLSAPQPGAKVMMTYYPGVRVQVVRRAGAEYVQVNVGERPATLTGYMRAEDLAFTEAGVRSVRGTWVNCDSLWGQPVYSYMDELSQRLGSLQAYNFVMGVSDDGWLHMDLSTTTEQPVTGFVYRGPDASGMRLNLANFVATVPMEGELTVEEAKAYARQQLLANGVIISGASVGDAISREKLDACECYVTVSYYFDDDALTYSVTFQDVQAGVMYAAIDLRVRGKQVLSRNYGNG